MAITALTHILRSIFLHIPGKPLLGMRPVVYTRIPWGAKKGSTVKRFPFSFMRNRLFCPA